MELYENLKKVVALRLGKEKVGSRREVKDDLKTLVIGCLESKKENDEEMYEAYLSALLLRFFDMVYSVKNRHKNLGVSFEDAYSIVYDSILSTISEKLLDKDENILERIFIASIENNRKSFIDSLFCEKRKATLPALSISLDKPCDDDDDDAATLGNAIGVNDKEVYSPTEELVELYFNKGEFLKAFIVDAIVNQHSFSSQEKFVSWHEWQKPEIVDDEVDEDDIEDEFVECTSKVSFEAFSKVLLLKTLRGINEPYIEYFASEYKYPINAVRNAVESINWQNIKRLCVRAFEELREDDDLLIVVGKKKAL